MFDLAKVLNAHRQVLTELEEENRRSTGSKIYVDKPQEIVYPRGHYVPKPPPLPEPAISRQEAEEWIKTGRYR